MYCGYRASVRFSSKRTTSLGLFFLVRSVSREGCTRFGSPGILG
jgi:hypothetical protein